tara:strand:+ start:1692 stop:2351 length:660 start_codon:yes stop_codon:yes gene_type:complete
MKVQINVPDSLKDITLEQYQKFEKLNTEENKDSSFLLQKMIEIFCNLNLRDVANIKYKSVQEITKHLNKVFDVKTDLTPTFKLGGIEFGFIPVLDDMTLGEYIDLDTYLGDWENMHKAMNVLYRPITVNNKNRYNIEDYKESDNTELFKDMPLNIAMGSLVFFWNLNSELLQITLKYLNQEAKKMNMDQRLALERSGVGINQSMDSLRRMLPSLTILQN